MHFQTSTGNLSGPTALPFFIFLCVFFTSSLLAQFYLFINHFFFLRSKLSVIFLVYQFLKVLLLSLLHCLQIYYDITVFILYNTHMLYIFSCSVSLPSQSVQLIFTFFCFQSSIQIFIHTSFCHRNCLLCLLFFSLYIFLVFLSLILSDAFLVSFFSFMLS